MSVSIVSEYPIRCPKPFQRLPELAYNLRWSWHPETMALFERIDATHWQRHRNPVKLLRERRKALRQMARDAEFLEAYGTVMADFDAYMNAPNTWYSRSYRRYQNLPIAYFSAEFGFHECLPIYCGGLGVLAGDHTKSASDLGLPFVAVGLFYKNGYFTQRLDAKGRQIAQYPEFKFAELPISPIRKPNGKRLIITVELPRRRVAAQCWLVRVGSARVILLDADVARNKPADRRITAQLYGGDREVRISQEMLLGLGGVRALRALDVDPGAWHLNEGHAAFVCLERLRELMQNESYDLDHAVEAVSANTVFTTHTPVAAGNEAFDLPLMDKYFRHFCNAYGIELPRLLSLGLQTGRRGEKNFSMTVMALRLSSASNGVSQLHGKVSRTMWKHLWPEIPEAELPIISITNGVHADTWLAPEMAELFRRYFGPKWRARLDDCDFWKKVNRIPGQTPWQIHQLLKTRLIHFARHRLAQQLRRNGASERKIKSITEAMNPEALTIGFARRFAAYKRADLIFSDIKRLEKLLRNAKQPVQIIFAGKAHPQDREGQAILRRVYQMTQRKNLQGKVILLEDYDMNVGRHLVQGVDVWLNNPRRPMEASGTSGQKVPLNGGINCSILDGWWAEGYNGANGWAVGNAVEGRSEAEQDRVDATALYEILEKEIVPLFYRRDRRGLPSRWIKKMKASMATLIPSFNTEAMVKNYVRQLYAPALNRRRLSESNRFAAAAEIAKVKVRLRENWPLVHVTHAEIAPRKNAKRNGSWRGKRLEVLAEVYLGELDPDLVQVELYTVAPSQNGTPERVNTIPLRPVHRNSDGVCRYQLKLNETPNELPSPRIRVRPRHQAMSHKHELGLIHWWELA